jgi:hypothetical protein
MIDLYNIETWIYIVIFEEFANAFKFEVYLESAT